ncbi:hypothetical protein INT48_008859 [Thamnidium elegans]|uniref:Secreted protein n=1 Tax=Thamnidium elegans TaxID=101142 RepID=A0A8H7VYK5_9FUNG|nr:hypothetical protein INT48_008859 [Thamnidium elegans]
MRASIAIALTAATAVSAVCNSSYNVPTSGTCFTGCNVEAGNVFLPGWTMDPASDKFIPSLKLMCSKGTPQYTAFMSKAGMCMMKCSDPQELFNNEFAGACGWYAEHKDDVCTESKGDTPAEGAANKLEISGLAMALVAGAGYLAL